LLNVLKGSFRAFVLLSLCLLLKGCDDHPWNDPYPNEDPRANTLYFAFTERPKHLDPARSYSEPEWGLIGQIYEPPLQYHYLKRPYVLEPLAALNLPDVHYISKTGQDLNADVDPSLVAYTDYIIEIKPNIFYAQHPAFAKDANGQYLYHHLTLEEAEHYHILKDFKERGTREVIAEDYVYQIKRLAEPHLASPIFGLMARYIVGLKELRETLLAAEKNKTGLERDLRDFSLKGVEVIDRYRYRIRLIGKYPQFHYWLAMPFFSPIPWEVAQFYAQAGLEAHNISLDWYPVGTGPYTLAENNPERRMTLEKNPNFRLELYPSEGTASDEGDGFLKNAGKPLPMVDKVIFTLEKETIPYWNKFLQGYYDTSAISSDNFGSSVRFTPSGGLELTEDLKKQGIQLSSYIAPGIWYWGFNMLDETLGGYTEEKRKIRQALSLAFDVEEYVNIFLNGRGVLAGGPIPPDIFGYDVQPKANTVDIDKAKRLLREAGVKEGLTIYFDTVVSGDPDEIANLAWLQKQFTKIGIRLIIRGTDFNRFQEKLQHGNVQLFFAGWHADYPDPENLLFLLYGPNASVKSGGENSTNYSNPNYDALFEKMRAMKDDPERLKVIQEMISILRVDNPWVWGFYPKSFALSHQWVNPRKPHGVADNTLKYISIDPVLRSKKIVLWNQPILWPFWVIAGLILLILLPVILRYWWKEHIPLERK